MTTSLYRGFSSHEYAKTNAFSITDVELVKLDLLNHIFTRRGERVMMPRFGTRIPDITFEPLDDLTISIVDEDLRTVFDFDPRVELIEMKTMPDYDNNALTVTARLLYIELNMVGNLDLNILFERG